MSNSFQLPEDLLKTVTEVIKKESVDKHKAFGLTEKTDPINKASLKKKFADRKDKDIDNDGDEDSSDEYLHKRRKAISKAMSTESKNSQGELEQVDEDMAKADARNKASKVGQHSFQYKGNWYDTRTGKPAKSYGRHGEDDDESESPKDRKRGSYKRRFKEDVEQVDEGFILRTVLKLTGLDVKAMKAFLYLDNREEIVKLADKAGQNPKQAERIIAIVKKAMKGDKDLVLPGTRLIALIKAKQGESMKEDVEQVQGIHRAAGRLAKEERLADKKQGEMKPIKQGSSSKSGDHKCAKHVTHEQWGEGNCIFSKHANPDEQGNIEWYDVMFEHGIEKNVPTKELEVHLYETHKH